MARYIDADALIKKIFPYDVVDKRCYTINAKMIYEEIQKAPTADVAPKSEVERWRRQLEAVLDEIPETKREVAREIIAFVHQLIDMQPYEGCWITTSGEEISADVGYFISGFEIVEKEILKKYTEEK